MEFVENVKSRSRDIHMVAGDQLKAIGGGGGRLEATYHSSAVTDDRIRSRGHCSPGYSSSGPGQCRHANVSRSVIQRGERGIQWER